MDPDQHPEQHPDPSLGDLGAELERAADGVTVGDGDELLAAVRERAAQRRRRRSAVVGLAAAATLVVSGVVVAQFVGGDDGDDRVASAPATEPPVTEADEPADGDASTTEQEVGDQVAADAGDTPTTADPVPGAADVPVDPATDPIAVPLVPATVEVLQPGRGAGDFPSEVRLHPWQGGVLAISTEYSPQPLPEELPTEISDAFPQEVRDLFPDGLPPTIQEATEILQEADLLDVVIDVLAENPDVNDAIYSESSPDPTWTVQFSADGVAWTDVDVDFPSGVDPWNAMTTTDDLFVAARPLSNDPAGAAGGPPPIPEAYEVLSSTDLVEWTTHTVPVPAPPAGLDPDAVGQAWIHSLAATSSGYVLSYEVMFEQPFDVYDLLPEDVQTQLDAGGFSIGQGPEGVTIGVGDPDDPSDTLETYQFTWEELGVDGPPSLDPSSDSHRYAGRWDGSPPVSVDDAVAWSNIRTVGDRFVETGPATRWSSDGVTWNPVAVPEGENVMAITDAGTGTALLTTDRTGESTLWIGDLEAGDWRPLDLADLPARAPVEMAGPGALLLADYGDPGYDDPYVDAVAMRQTAEVDGFRYEMESTFGGAESETTYRLTDLATGEVVLTETLDSERPDGTSFEFYRDGAGFGDGFELLDPVTGEQLVVIPYDSLLREVVAADGTVTDLSTFEPPAPTEGPPDVEHQLLAFVDDGLILTPVDSGGDEFGPGFVTSVLALDDSALFARFDGTISRVLPT